MERVIRGSKGGGCFKKGSLVQLENNKTVPIEELKIGDEILSFNERGEICLSKVTKTHFHELPEPLILVKFWNGSVEITPNHWVQNQYGSFVEVGTLTIEDAIVDGMGHLRPIISIEPLESEPVYNLTVEPNHTFICNNARVHNGGHRNRYPVVGSKGGGSKGGGGRVAVEAPDSLQSRAYANVLDLICEGEIGGLVAGAQSIYLDEVPLQNTNGTYNFSGAIWDFKTGTQDQTYIPGFTNTQSVSQVGVQVKGYTPAKSPAPAYDPVPVTRRYTNANTDGVIVTISVPALQVQDMNTGDVNGTSVKLQVEQQFNDGGFVPANVNIIWNSINTIETVTVTNNILKLPVLGFNKIFSKLFLGGNSTYTETIACIISANTSQIKANVVLEHHCIDADLSTYEDIVYKVEESSDNGATWSTIKIVTKEYSYEVPFNTFASIIFPLFIKVVNKEPQVIPGEEIFTTFGPVLDRKLKLTILSGGSISGCQGYSAGHNNIITISGKASSKYQRSFFVPFTQAGTWDIRVSRITNESTSQALANETWWDLETEVIYAKLNYANSAVAALSVDASQFGSIPQRAYDVKLLKIQIPSNYNPITRRYNRDKDTGISSGDDKSWDGTFYVAWSNNPTWCFYDLITNERYGLGSFIDSTKVDKWALYTIGKYCDELVPTGKLDMVEPRFTCNMYIQTRDEAYKLINDMASIFRGMVYWASGAITAIQDAPADPTYLFNQSNVIDGLFTYSGSSAKARHTVALVSWNDMTDMCRPKVEYVEDAVGIEKYGVIESNIVAVGCTSQGQAHRVGKWLLQSELTETEVVSFKTGLEGAGSAVRPGAIIAIADPIRAGDRLGGRILQVIDDYTIVVDNGLTSVSIGSQTPVFDSTLFDSVLFDQAVSDGLDTISVFDSTGAVNEVGIHSIVGTTITFNTPVPNMYVGGLWIISTNEVNKQLFRVLSVVEDKGIFEISALEHNPDKYATVEYGLNLEEKPISNLSIYPSAPTGLTLTESLYIDKANILIKISASWEPVVNANGYVVSYKAENGNMSSELKVQTPQIDIPNVTQGKSYQILIWSIGAAGNRSLEYVSDQIFIYGKLNPPAGVTGVIAQIQDNKVKVSWNAVTDLDLSHYEVRTSDSGWGIDTNYLYNGDQTNCLLDAPEPSTSTIYYVRAVDTTGNYSLVSGSISFNTSVVPAVYGPSIQIDFQNLSTSSASILVQWPSVFPPFGLKYYKFVKGSNSPIYINSNYITIPADWTGNETLYISVIDMNDSESTVTEKVIEIFLPGQVPNPTISLTKVSGEVVMNFSWTPTTVGTLPIAGYEIRSTDTGWGDSAFVYKGSANTAIVPNIISSLGQTWYIRAFDTRNNYSATSRSILLDDLVPPSQPAAFTAIVNTIPVGLKLAWTESTSLDVVAYEVRTIDSGWGINDSSRIYYGSDVTKIINLENTGTYNFYLRARDASDRWSTSATVQFIYAPVTPLQINDINTLFLDDQVSSAEVKISWPDATPQFGIKHYRITYDSIDFIQIENNLTVPANWIGSKDFTIYVVDNNGNSSTGTIKTITRYPPAQLTGITSEVSDTKVKLSWSTPVISSNSGYLPIAGYEVRLIDEDWGLSNPIYKGNATSVLVSPSSNGNGTWYIKPYDTDNEYAGDAATVTFTAQVVPNISDVVYSFFDTSTTSATITLEWNNVSPQYGLKHYRVAYGSKSYTSNSNSIIVPADWIGDRTFTVYTVDRLDRESTGYQKIVSKYKPNKPLNFYPQVVDNTVMLTWTAPSPTSLPVSHYIIKEGTTWATAYDLGRKDGAFTTVTELKKGTYTYWIVAVDTDDIESDPESVTCEVAEPPDFVYHDHLFANYQVGYVEGRGDTIAVNYTNAKLDNNAIVLPVNLTEEYQQHFTNNSWTSPQAQVTAGYPIFITPSPASGSYSETWDVGTILASSKLIVSIDSELNGLMIVPTIEITSTTESSWNTSDPNYKAYPGVWEVFGVNFRYVRVTLTINSTDTSKVARFWNLNVLLNAKAISSGGTESIVSQGQIINFNKEFIDVTSLTVTPNTTSPLIAVYDYKDTVYPATYTITNNICTVTQTGHPFISGQAVKLSFYNGTGISNTYYITDTTTDTYNVSMTAPNCTGNLLKYSADMRNAAEAGTSRPWYQSIDGDVQVAISSTLAPNGLPACKMSMSTTGLVKRQISQAISTGEINTIHCSSVLAKAGEVHRIRLHVSTRTPNWPAAIFDLDTGTVIGNYASWGETLSGSGIESLGGGWFRCWVAADIKTGASNPGIVIQPVAGTTYYSGAIGDGVYLSCAQFEQATLPNPYIPTVASPVGNGASAYSQSFRVYLFDSSSGSPPTFGSYNVSWFAKGY